MNVPSIMRDVSARDDISNSACFNRKFSSHPQFSVRYSLLHRIQFLSGYSEETRFDSF